MTRMPLTTGTPSLDEVISGVMPGDNIVYMVDSIEDYIPFIHPYCEALDRLGWPLIYFRFAGHRSLLPEGSRAVVHTLQPELGFEPFISEIYSVIEKYGKGAYYLFDSLSELVVDWYSDRMLGIFFKLTCPYLYTWDTVACFALLKNYHSSNAVYLIHSTAQVILEVYRTRDKIYLHPQKAHARYTRTLFMLHVWEKERFLPVTRSAEVTEILSRVPQPWLDFTSKRPGVWTRAFEQARETLDNVRQGKQPARDEDAVFRKLLRMAFTRDEKLAKLAERHLHLEDLIAIKKRMIGTGLIGGKSAGMLLARKILVNHDRSWAGRLEEHDSFFVGSDFFYNYLVENNCWSVLRKQRHPETVLEGADEARKKILSGRFPGDIVDQFREMLDYFGQSPIIVRSSSLLEDNYGNAFSGKYESVFCISQGNPEERLQTFMDAVRTVYASTMSREALLYRADRGLLEQDEQMALLVQRVSGGISGELFFPLVAGVGFSFNPFVWNREIDPAAGMLRLVVGLGTRAVDRSDDDYTRIVSLSAPHLRPEAGVEERRRYSQSRVDVLDFRQNRFAQHLFADIAPGCEPHLLELVASRDTELERRRRESGAAHADAWLLTFEALFDKTGFVADMKELLAVLKTAYDCPVDVEFTANFMADGGCRINLVQCRPFQIKGEGRLIARAAAPAGESLLFRTRGPVVGNSRALTLGRIIHVVPETYSRLGTQERYTVARLVGRLAALDNADGSRNVLLLGPGRWGTSTPALGVPVSFAEISRVRAICELALMHEGVVPDVSLGTHFFNDLVEADILYLAIHPDREGHEYPEARLLALPDMLERHLPAEAAWAHVVRVYEPGERAFQLYGNALEQEGFCWVE